jgi:DsbC/DsbD-like thiol-disulfide interchange protein
MKRDSFARLALALLLLAAALAPARPTSARVTTHEEVTDPEPEPQAENVGVNGFLSVDRAQQGGSFQGAIVLDIPRGMHVNANKPLSKFSVPTVVKVDAPRGFRVTPVSYPRGSVRTFSFGGADATRIAVYEGRAILRFNVSVPAGQPQGVGTLRFNVRFQSCTDEVCYPPATRNVELPVAVVGADAQVRRINGNLFGGGGRRRR